MSIATTPVTLDTILADMTARCTACGICVDPCAFLRQEGTPSALAQRARTDASSLGAAYRCSLCGLCDALCPERLSPATMFLAMRRSAIAQGLVDLKPYAPWLNYEKLGGRFPFRRYLIPQGCDTVFFPGCSLPGTRPQAVTALLNELRRGEPTTGLVLDCCGKISHDLGLTERFSTIFGRLRQRLRDRGIRRIFTACPGCAKMLRMLGEDVEVRSIYELLAGQEPARQPLPVAAPVSAAIHDPCPARFDPAQQQAVRQLARRAGYAIEELPSSGRNTRCCGQGGMVEGRVPGTLRRESAIVADQAAGRLLISSCAACVKTLARHTPTLHVLDLWRGDRNLSQPAVSSAQRWLNRLILRFRYFP